MKQLTIIVPLKPGAHERAEELLAGGAPFDPEEAGFERHAVFLTDREVVFVFEGRDVEWILDDILDDAFHPLLQDALHEWKELVDGSPRRCRTVYSWTREETAVGAGGAGDS